MLSCESQQQYIDSSNQPNLSESAHFPDSTDIYVLEKLHNKNV